MSGWKPRDCGPLKGQYPPEVDSWVMEDGGDETAGLVIYSDGEKVTFKDRATLDLVCAAPEMAEALRALTEAEDVAVPFSVAAMVDHALAKAEGRGGKP